MAKPKRSNRPTRGPQTTGAPNKRRDSYETLSPSIINNMLELLEEGELPPQELKETESWLDWGIGLLKEWGPKALEMAPALLALL